MESMSPALAGGFLTAGLPGKSVSFIFNSEREMETFSIDYAFYVENYILIFSSVLEA